MGIDTMASYAHQFGLGEETGVELPSERVGIVPSTAWKQKAKHEPWLPGETISAAIGQGYVTVTPLQMASLIGTVANDGVTYRPRLVQAIMDRSDRDSSSNCRRWPKRTLNVKPGHVEADSRSAGRSGEGRDRHESEVLSRDDRREDGYGADRRTSEPVRRRTFPRSSAIMRGLWRLRRSRAPKIAVAVLAEHMGHGGSAAAPLAKELIETYMKVTAARPSTLPDGASTPAQCCRRQGTT